MIFYGDLKIKTHPGVYEPSDDSHLLAENLSVRGGDSVLDVGTGTGFVALVASGKADHVLGVDVSPQAVNLSNENARLNNINNVEFRVSDLLQNVDGRFDLISFNPPYLPESRDDPHDVSWSGGESGVDVIVDFIGSVSDYLKSDGRFRLVLSTLCDLDFVMTCFMENGFGFNVVAEKKLFFERLHVVEGRGV